MGLWLAGYEGLCFEAHWPDAYFHFTCRLITERLALPTGLLVLVALLVAPSRLRDLNSALRSPPPLPHLGPVLFSRRAPLRISGASAVPQSCVTQRALLSKGLGQSPCPLTTHVRAEAGFFATAREVDLSVAWCSDTSFGKKVRCGFTKDIRTGRRVSKTSAPTGRPRAARQSNEWYDDVISVAKTRVRFNKTGVVRRIQGMHVRNAAPSTPTRE